jgi:hypothetical protein
MHVLSGAATPGPESAFTPMPRQAPPVTPMLSQRRFGLPSRPEKLPSRRELLSLSAVLAATTLTAGAAIAGLAHKPTATVQIVPTVSQPSAPAARFQEPQEPGG